MTRKSESKPEKGLLFVSAGSYDALRPSFDFIPGMLHDSTVAIIYGPPQSGKTFFALHLLCSATLGRRLFGVTPEKRRGLYVGLEGESGIKARVQAWCVENKEETNPIHYALGRFDLSDAEQISELIGYMKKHGIQFVVIDTLSLAMAGLDEIAGQHMTYVMDQLHRIKRETGACVVAIAHTGKNERAGIRGHSSQLGNVDTTIEIRTHNRKAQKGARGEADTSDEPVTLDTPRSAIVRKQRDGESGRAVHFTLKLHDSKVRDARGHVMRSPALCEHEAFVAIEEAPEGARLTKREREAKVILDSLNRRLGRAGPATLDQFQRELKRKGWGPERADSWRSAFRHLRERLDVDSNDEITFAV